MEQAHPLLWPCPLGSRGGKASTATGPTGLLILALPMIQGHRSEIILWGGIKLSYEVFTIQPLMRNLLTVTGQEEGFLVEPRTGINWGNL